MIKCGPRMIASHSATEVVGGNCFPKPFRDEHEACRMRNKAIQAGKNTFELRVTNLQTGVPVSVWSCINARLQDVVL